MRWAPILLAAATVLAGQVPRVEEPRLRAHLAFLADDLLEGRGTGQRGGDLAVKYLETQLQGMGLQPPTAAGYLQKVRLHGIRLDTDTSSLEVVGGQGRLAPRFLEDAVIGTGVAKAAVTVDAPLLFAGYGIEAPEEHWDDFKGADLRGKVLVLLVNDPQPTAAEPNRFGGRGLTYYGRWTYKYEQARRHGAAGVLLVHTDAAATYPWSVVRSSWGVERFQMADAEGSPLQGWITESWAKALLAAAGQDLDELRRRAERRDFAPVELGLRLKASLHSAVRALDQANVAAVVPGTDPLRKGEAVIYSAHWDHFGVAPSAPGEPPKYYIGAVDNASGCAALLAMAEAAARRPAPRTQMFLFVCAEEQGLLGSTAYMKQPLWPLQKTAADLNLDALNFVGATEDINLFGADRSELGEIGRTVLAGMGLVEAAAAPDTTGWYFRSDHFPFAKAGVPAFSIGSGRRWKGDAKAAEARAATYGGRYHQVTDRYEPGWDLSGMVQQAQVALALGYAVAERPAMPRWKKGEPWGKGRD